MTNIINITDRFLCNNLKIIVNRTEQKCTSDEIKLDLAKEFDMLNQEAIACREQSMSCFQKKVKADIKILLGVFFVAIPFIVLLIVSYLLSLPYTYAVVFTLAIAIFSSLRMENIVYKYTQLRRTTINKL